jgi:hypothetical protein
MSKSRQATQRPTQQPTQMRPADDESSFYRSEGGALVFDPAVCDFRALQSADFPLLLHWLNAPHVRQWWQHDPSALSLA